MPRFVQDVDLASRLERIRELADRLAKAHDDFSEQQEIVEKIRQEIEAAKRALRPPT